MEDILAFVLGVCFAIIGICAAIFSIAMTYKFLIDVIL